MKKSFAIAAVSALALMGCATSSLLNDAPTAISKSTKMLLVEDRVVAFGRPATNAGLSSDHVVIVGEKHSYVLGSGGYEFANLLGRLDLNYISVDSNLDFYSEKNDGQFGGTLKLSYAKLKDDFSRSDLQFFLQNKGKECSSEGDVRMGAQRFCFVIPLNGKVYPQVSNYDLVRAKYTALSRPYHVSIHTTSTSQTASSSGVEKLVFFPLALAFDVVTLPFQILGAID